MQRIFLKKTLLSVKSLVRVTVVVAKAVGGEREREGHRDRKNRCLQIFYFVFIQTYFILPNLGNEVTEFLLGAGITLSIKPSSKNLVILNFFPYINHLTNTELIYLYTSFAMVSIKLNSFNYCSQTLRSLFTINHLFAHSEVATYIAISY